MLTPRFAYSRHAALLAALLLGLIGPGLAAGGEVGPAGSQNPPSSRASGQDGSSPAACQNGRRGQLGNQPEVDEEEENDTPLPDAERLRLLQVLSSVMALSPFMTPPPNNTVPMVVKPPTISPASVTPDTPGQPTIAATSPEPTSIVSALLGSISSGLVILLRRRRARRHETEEEDLEEEDFCEQVALATAA